MWIESADLRRWLEGWWGFVDGEVPKIVPYLPTATLIYSADGGNIRCRLGNRHGWKIYGGYRRSVSTTAATRHLELGGRSKWGIYSGDCYRLLDWDSSYENQDGVFTTLWKLKIPSKASFFAWRLIRDRLPTKNNLRSKMWKLTTSDDHSAEIMTKMHGTPFSAVLESCRWGGNRCLG